MPVSTGNGREYLVYFLGEKSGGQEDDGPTFWSDAFSYQVPALPVTAAGIKDATRQVMGVATGEDTWAEVGVEVGVEKEGEGKAHPGPRGWFACCGVEGGVVVWGGVSGKGEVEGDGWLVEVGAAK